MPRQRTKEIIKGLTEQDPTQGGTIQDGTEQTQGRGVEILQAFRLFDAECRANTEDSPTIEALNRMKADDRVVIVLHVATRGNVTATAEFLQCDRHTMRKYLMRLACQLEGEIKAVNRARELQEWLRWK